MLHLPQVDYSLAETILRRAELDPDNRAIVFEEKEYTYRELVERIRRLATVLKTGGVCQGDRVGYLGVNHPAFLETLLATTALGAVFVPLNFRLTGTELEFIINDAGIHTLVTDDMLRPVSFSESVFHCSRDATLVAYDRPGADLRPAWRVGCPSVLMSARWSRSAGTASPARIIRR